MDRNLRILIGLIFFIILSFSFTLTALADSPITVTTTIDEYDVPANGTCSLREAVASANTGNGIGGCNVIGADTVILTGTTYLLTLGELDITSTMTISGVGSAATIIEGNATARIIDNSDTLTITGVTITNGSAPNGGGIRNSGTLVVQSSVITDNTADQDGGGIYNTGVLTMTGSFIRSNDAGNDGGGLANQNATATLDNTVVDSNTAGDGSGVGGGISNAAQSETTILTLNQSRVTTNTLNGTGGGGISNSADDGETALLMLNQTLVSGNVATATTVNSSNGYGGGIRNGYFDTTITGGTAMVNIDASTISGNIALNGGGIGNGTENTSGTTTEISITNSTISGNTVAGTAGVGESIGNGGGIANLDGLVTLENSTVSGNVADGVSSGGFAGLGGGIGNNSDNLDATIWMTNTTVASNTAAVSGTAIAGLRSGASNLEVNFTNTIVGGTCADPLSVDYLNSQGHNLASDSTCLTENVTTKDNVDPNLLLGTLTNNGGNTATHALLAGSPAIDAGTCTGAPATDQNDQARPNAVSSFCDVGAYESNELGVVDLEIDKTVNAALFVPGQAITYTLTFTNNSSAALSGVVITDSVPVTITNVTSTSTGATITPTTGYTYAWTVADLAWGDGGVITLSGVIDPNLAVGGDLTNEAEIDSPNTDTDSGNNRNSATVTIPDINLNLSKTATDSLDGAVTTITYTLAVSNPTAYKATNVVVSDTLPSEVYFVSSDPTTYNENTGVWTVGDVNAGTQVTLTLVVTATLDTDQVITNTAEITDLYQVDSNTANNSDWVETSGSGGSGGVYLPIILRSSS